MRYSNASNNCSRDTRLPRSTRHTVINVTGSILLLVILPVGSASIFPPIMTHGACVQQDTTWTLERVATPKWHLKRKPRPAGYTPQVQACLRINHPEMHYSYWVEATYDTYATDHPPSELRFVRETPGQPNLEFKRVGDGSVVNMMSVEGGSVLAIVFELGSALEVKTFRLEKNTVTPIFQRGTKFPPEFLEGAIIVHTGWVPMGDRCCTAKETEIWTWTGNNYRLASTVPYGKGYSALAELPPTAWK